MSMILRMDVRVCNRQPVVDLGGLIKGTVTPPHLPSQDMQKNGCVVTK